jgi:hypothetical protein
MGKNGREFVVSLGNFTHHEVSSLLVFEAKVEVLHSGAERPLRGGTNLWQNSWMGAIKGGLEFGAVGAVALGPGVYLG